MKKILYILVFLCVSVAAASLYLSQFTGKPNTIDCMKGREAAFLMGGLHDTMNDPPKPGCPGYDDMTQGEIGTYKLGPYTFNIPRDYLWQGKYNEGEVGGLYLFIEYPSMKPAIEQFKEPGWHDEIKVTLKYLSKCPQRPCLTKALNWYQIRAHQGKYKNTSIIYTKSSSEIRGFDSYTARYRKGNDRVKVYYKGNIERPRAWYICEIDQPSPSCETEYMVSEALWVKYIFSYDLLVRHKKMQINLTKFLKTKLYMEDH